MSPVCATADYTTLKQAKEGGDFKLARVRQLIKEIGLVLAELDIDPQTYLTRSFCILEIFAAVEAGATLLVQMHFLKAFDVATELAARPVDAKKAQTRSPEQKATIDGFVEAMPGGFKTLNATVTEAIKKAAAVIAKQFSASQIFLEEKGLTAHDATVVAEILKSMQQERDEGPPAQEQGDRRRGRQGAGGGAQGERDGGVPRPHRLRHRRRRGGGARRGAPLQHLVDGARPPE